MQDRKTRLRYLEARAITERLEELRGRKRTREAASQMLAAAAINRMAEQGTEVYIETAPRLYTEGVVAVMRFIESVHALADLEIAKLAGVVPS